MKILLVSDAGSIHTKRWASSLKDAGVDIVLFSITPAADDFYDKRNIKLYVFDLFRYKKNDGLHKNIPLPPALAAHAKAVAMLKNVLKKECPDILHAHYATSYGMVAALAGFHPFIMSVWGSDVYEFPRQSLTNRLAVEFMLKRADRVLSTSGMMASEASKYYKGEIGVTPFGVDLNIFRTISGHSRRNRRRVVFGTVKTLSHKYGIDLLVRAFARMRQMLAVRGSGNVAETGLLIAGKGPDRDALESLASELGVASFVNFLGDVPHDKVPGIYSDVDVAVFLSRAESFGVSAVEAMACSVPVIASDADGFREILENGAGIIVPGENAEAAAEAMFRLAVNEEERWSLGEKGRRRAEERYDWQKNVETMLAEYRNVLDKAHAGKH